jgi:eukaryotic-like serine/threonine-protein kinase
MGERAIFFEALDKADPAAREAYLNEACAGDPDLRRRVLALLQSHVVAGDFLDMPAAEQLAAGAGMPADSGRLGAGFAPPPEPRCSNVPLDFLAPAERPGSLGRLGHYEVLEVVGQGGMGIVLRGFDEKLHRVVAIKVLAPALATTGSARQRFVREAQAAAAVTHDNVIGIHAVEDHGAMPYLVMEFVSGPTLQEKLERTGPLPLVEILRIGMQVAAGLAAAHAQGLVHRDVKPANILLENGIERVKITDFGLARAVDDASLTHSGLVAGTPAYMSPEQADGGHVDQRSDLFSLGSVLYTLGAGHAPFRASTTMAVLKRVCEESPRALREVNVDIPDWLAAVVVRLHAKDPAGRFQTAAEVAELLGRYLAHVQQPDLVPAPDAACPERPPEVSTPPPRHRAPRLMAAAAIFLLAAGLGAAEAAGFTDIRGTVVRLIFPDGTLIVEVDDPAVSVAIDGTDLVITGSGAREIRLKPGAYEVRASKDGRVVRRELVTVVRGGRPVVRISKEANPPDEAERWEQSLAGRPAAEQVEAVTRRLKELNPGFDGEVIPGIADGEVKSLQFHTDAVLDIAPVRALPGLRSLDLRGTYPSRGKLSDLTPLRGLPLVNLNLNSASVSDLGPLRGMPLTVLHCGETRVADLSPLKGMRLRVFSAQRTLVSDLEPLRGMPLTYVDLYGAHTLADLGPLEGMPLGYLNIGATWVSDLSPVAGLKSLRTLVIDETEVSNLTAIRRLELTTLSFIGIRVTDLSPIRGMHLKYVRLDYRPEREEFLRSLAGLKSINERPVAEFWKGDKGR